jgi:hypothetical protein
MNATLWVSAPIMNCSYNNVKVGLQMGVNVSYRTCSSEDTQVFIGKEIWHTTKKVLFEVISVEMNDSDCKIKWGDKFKHVGQVVCLLPLHLVEVMECREAVVERCQIDSVYRLEKCEYWRRDDVDFENGLIKEDREKYIKSSGQVNEDVASWKKRKVGEIEIPCPKGTLELSYQPRSSNSRRECKDASQDTKKAIEDYCERFFISAAESGMHVLSSTATPSNYYLPWNKYLKLFLIKLLAVDCVTYSMVQLQGQCVSFSPDYDFKLREALHFYRRGDVMKDFKRCLNFEISDAISNLLGFKFSAAFASAFIKHITSRAWEV